MVLVLRCVMVGALLVVLVACGVRGERNDGEQHSDLHIVYGQDGYALRVVSSNEGGGRFFEVCLHQNLEIQAQSCVVAFVDADGKIVQFSEEELELQMSVEGIARIQEIRQTLYERLVEVVPEFSPHNKQESYIVLSELFGDERKIAAIHENNALGLILTLQLLIDVETLWEHWDVIVSEDQEQQSAVAAVSNVLYALYAYFENVFAEGGVDVAKFCYPQHRGAAQSCYDFEDIRGMREGK